MRILICILVAQALAAEAPLPFWKTKEKAIARINSGEVLVLAKDVGGRLDIQGGGRVRAPCDFVYAYAKDFDHLEHLGLYFERARYDRALGLVDVRVSALGHHADFKVRAQSYDGEDPHRIAFEIASGPLEGLRAQLRFVSLDVTKCEVGIDGELKYTAGVLYRLALGFGLEVAFQRMAVRLRDQVQHAYAETPRGVDR